MPSFNTLLGATALAAVAMANPVPSIDISLKNFVIHESVVKAPKAAVVYLANTYAKYNKPAPKDVSTAAAGSGSVVATPEPYDSEYLCPVTLGGQTLNLDFDTGSADLWVFSSELSAANQAGHDIYNPAKSSTSKKLSGYTWKISYGDGSGASGDVYTDNVSVGGVTVTGQAVECASQISSQFQQDTDNDGLLGLAFSSINTVSPNKQTTFFDTAVNEGKLTSSLFTVDLKKGKPGSYGFGAIDSTKYTGSIAYTPVDSSQGFWSFSTTGYGVGSKYTTKSSSGIADTGTTLILVDDSTVSAYYAAVSGAKYDSTQGGYTFACSATLPSFTVGIGSNKYVVPGSYINFAPIDSTGKTCFGGIQSSSGIGFNIYGDVFLKAVFAVFDKNGPRLGFATKTL